jgi:HK97 family phage prohead protease
MPFANEHASRIISPKELESRAGFESVRRTHGSGKGKVQDVSIPTTIDVIWYVYKDGTVIAQTLRFPIEHWTSTEALKWLKDNKIKYLSFEKATNGKSTDEFLTKNLISEFSIKDLDEPQGIIRLYANAYNNLDSDRDISEPGSFTKTCRENLKRIKHLKDHKRDMLLGFPMEFNCNDPFGLLVTSKINMNKDLCRDTFSDYKFFAENKRPIEHSIGYSVVKFSIENPDDWSKRIRKIQEYKLYEYSTLSFLGANERSTAVEAKGLDSLKSEVELLNEMLTKGDYTDEKFKQIEIKLSEIQEKIKEMKTLNETEPEQSTLEIVEPDSLFKGTEINFIKIINQIKFT